ncbi:MAG TPA: nucleoside triphosphate pyrophosphatase [Rhizomicrobium sp.]|jgi:septum formation protein|nr:nucleoside triphosphate pyrophosphatase [Rhizomicrobium sp.]
MSGLVLASGSVTRATLLANAGIAFDIMPADIDEDEVKQELRKKEAAPEEVARTLAVSKALEVSRRRPNDMVLGADQVLVFEGEIVSKSESLEEARELLMRLRGSSHTLITATALINRQAIWRYADKSELTMRDFSEEFLDEYLESEGVAILGSVGCYRLEGLGMQLFEKIDGDYFSILGLPLLPVLAVLREQGVVIE